MSFGIKEQPYLIIAGTTKAATTALFFYLNGHPEICASNMKETCFFLDADYPYPIPPTYRLEDGMDKYNQFFGHCRDNKLRLEATPDYLYSVGTPKKIKASLPQVRLIFILREPTSRLISWYRFAQQLGRLAPNVSFESYVREQLRAMENGASRPQHLHTLEQGLYSIYLQRYLDIFDRTQILVLWHEDLIKAPRRAIQEVCSFAGVDSAFYELFDFKIYNQTLTMRSPGIHRIYAEICQRLRTHVHNQEQIRKALRAVRLAIEPIYLRLNSSSLEKVILSPEIISFLDDYYSSEVTALERLVGVAPPWQ